MGFLIFQLFNSRPVSLSYLTNCWSFKPCKGRSQLCTRLDCIGQFKGTHTTTCWILVDHLSQLVYSIDIPICGHPSTGFKGKKRTNAIVLGLSFCATFSAYYNGVDDPVALLSLTPCLFIMIKKAINNRVAQTHAWLWAGTLYYVKRVSGSCGSILTRGNCEPRAGFWRIPTDWTSCKQPLGDLEIHVMTSAGLVEVLSLHGQVVN